MALLKVARRRETRLEKKKHLKTKKGSLAEAFYHHRDCIIPLSDLAYACKSSIVGCLRAAASSKPDSEMSTVLMDCCQQFAGQAPCEEVDDAFCARYGG